MPRTRKHIPPLTKEIIDSLTEPGRYAEGTVPNLYMKVSTTKTKFTISKSWVFMWQRGKKVWEPGLGSWTGAGKAGRTSIPLARKKALAIHEQIAEGKNPMAEKKRNAMTFAKCGTALLDSLKPTFRNKKTEDGWNRSLTLHAAAIADMPVNAIGVEDILGILKPVWLEKAETAKQLRGRVERVLDFAKAKGYRSGDNPAAWRGNLDHLLPKRPKLQKGHHPALPYADVPDFVAGLDTASDPALPPLLLTILTAVRSGETRLAEWSEFDMDKALWTVPKARTKTGERDHIVPLSKPALAILAAQERRTSESRVFPALEEGDMRDALSRLVSAKIAVPHGFRSSFRDWAGDETGFARETAEEILGHRIGNDTENAYRRSIAVAKRRKLLDAWGAYVTGNNNVTALKRA
ncbi:tyrosine-type recombinase/integrase [Phyllobacterium sp. LjRoot231]|uniref:tyrosine-type recombinase/integrase n=1 Tax=Phyllobacterium sp. LjRoot231 TaxID=3342289 RepID=UPI003ECCB245